jgi:hypothetical protein
MFNIVITSHLIFMTQGTEHSSYFLQTGKHRKWLVVAGRKCPTILPVYGKWQHY